MICSKQGGVFLKEGHATSFLDPIKREDILADFLRKNRAEAIEVSIFEYDDKKEKELIRKAEYAEGEKAGREAGLKEGEKKGTERIFEIHRMFQKKYTENQIAEQTGMDVGEVQKILKLFSGAL